VLSSGRLIPAPAQQAKSPKKTPGVWKKTPGVFFGGGPHLS
jgi:hypothetical protein